MIRVITQNGRIPEQGPIASIVQKLVNIKVMQDCVVTFG